VEVYKHLSPGKFLKALVYQAIVLNHVASYMFRVDVNIFTIRYNNFFRAKLL